MKIILSLFLMAFSVALVGQQLKNIDPKIYLPIQDDFQDDEEFDEDPNQGWTIGINIGMYFANKKTANLYNGTCLVELTDAESGLNCYTIEERLGLTSSIFNVNTYNNVVNDLQNTYPQDGLTGFRGDVDMYPWNMRYRGAMMYGLNISYNFNAENAIVINSNLMRLTATDAFILIMEGASPQPNQPELSRLFTVWGEENRFNLQLGYKKGWEINEKARWVFEIGGNLLGASVEANKIEVGGREYDLLLGGDNPANLFQYVPRTQVSLGIYGSPGIEFTFKDNFRAMLGASFMRDNVKLETYEDTVWNSSVFLRVGLE